MSHMLTDHFSWEEFDCHDGTPVPNIYWGNVKLLALNLEYLRQHLGRPIQIVSGYRTAAHNKSVGGAKSSQHLTASAADVKIEGIQPKEVKAAIERLILEKRMSPGGIGLYPTWVHYDIRGTNARW